MFKHIKNKKLRIFIIVIIILFILGIITYYVLNNLKTRYRSFYEVGEELVLENTYTNIFNEIDIETKMTDIYIKNSNDNTIKVIVYGEKDYIDVKEMNNKLYIDIKEKNFIAFDFYKYISKIEIYLPSWYNKLIRIDSEFGNIEIEEFNDCTLYVKQEYGNILSKGSNFIKVKNEYGNIELTKSNKARVEAESGDVKIGTINNLEVINEYGDIDIDNITQYFKLSNEMGDIKINRLNIEENSFIEMEHGDIKIDSINQIYVDAKTDHGDVDIKVNYDQAKTILKIYNEMGDIKID